MTDPLQSCDVELLKKYDAEFQQLESLPPAVIELTAVQALALVTHLQIAAANPAVKYNPLLPSAIAAAKEIQKSFNPQSAIHEVLELGWQAEKSCDSQNCHKYQTKRSQRLTRRSSPPYWPDNIPYNF
jgi:hypothetical protein